jgi:PSP1 C-terminal conserved region
MESEYLVSYGPLGDFGRFSAAEPLECVRGDRVVVRTLRGLELGEVLSPTTTQHRTYLSDAAVGSLLRRVTPADEKAEYRLRERGDEVFTAARQRTSDLGLPLEVIDVETLLDGEHVVLHFIRWADCDVRELVSGLSKQFSLHVLLQDLTAPTADTHEDHGCSSCGSGGCGSGGCGSGGCGSGSCGAGKAEEVQAYFAGLREKMMNSNRMPLL